MPSLLRINPAAKKRIMESVSLESVNLDSAVNNLKEAMAELEKVFVNRTEEINAITLAIATGQHVLLKGKHGVAKSDLAREAFRRITGARVYDKMFTKATPADDVFGPTLIEKLKEGVWEHNIDGSLATADFANLEELGRASDILLPSMMTVLNERIFHNGKKVVNCPLKTAIATANFITENDDLAAFNDRWLIVMEVKPLPSVQLQNEMVKRSLRPRIEPSKFVTMREILAIQAAVRSCSVETEVIPLYTDLISQYKKAANLDYISDRRIVSTFKLARARAVLEQSMDKDDKLVVTPDHLEVIRYGISVVGQADDTTFGGVLQRVVGNIAELKKESENANVLLKYAKKLQDGFDTNNDLRTHRKMRAECLEIIKGYQGYNKPIQSPDNKEKFTNAVAIVQSLKQTLDEILSDVASAVDPND